ncbi:nitrate reductase cytochrome c-type subunit, partial [Shewanella sp. 0m-11]
RKRTRMSQAPMVSVTHFKSWDGNFLAELSPTRYFCSQCHVVQTDAKLLVPNNFVDMDSLVKEEDKVIDTQSSK